MLAQERVLRIELQLVEAIDMLVGSLRAGSSLLASFESAADEAELPLRSYFDEIVGRIRLGDDARTVLGGLPDQIPLETFRLFASALAVHWEVGGSLASTLSTVGRTLRDRIELARRVRAQGVEAHVSVAVVMGIWYILGYLMWRSDPERLDAFLRTDVGAELIAVAIALQATGLIWMSRLSRSSF
ncbi:MAG: type II secretion system F family protein [Vicinamibacterales bacterium]